MRSVGRSLVFVGVLFAMASVAAAQDLGSANKLFGGTIKPAGKKATPGKKKVASAPSSTPKKKAATTRSPAKPGDKSTARKAASPAREITAPTGKKAIRQPEKSLPSKPYDKDRFSADRNSKADAAPANPDVSRKLTPAEEARFEEMIEEADAARDEREYARAESLYKNARAIKARDPRVIYGLGNVYSDQQRWDEAENSYRAALQMEPAGAPTHIALSYVLTQPLPVADLSDRYAEAEKLARRAVELAPRSAPAFDQLGVAMEMRGQIGQETENAYRRAVALDPGFAPAYAHLGRLLRRRGQIEQSHDAYHLAADRLSDVRTIVVVAEVMQSEQHFADSIPLLRQALNAAPADASALLMMGRALTVTGQYTDAESMLRRALSVSPASFTANSLLASLYSRQGAYELAENALLQAMRTAPRYEHRNIAQAFVTVAQGYTKAGKSQQARRAYAKAAEIDPDSGAMSGRFRQ